MAPELAKRPTDFRLSGPNQPGGFLPCTRVSRKNSESPPICLLITGDTIPNLNDDHIIEGIEIITTCQISSPSGIDSKKLSSLKPKRNSNLVLSYVNQVLGVARTGEAWAQAHRSSVRILRIPS